MPFFLLVPVKWHCFTCDALPAWLVQLQVKCLTQDPSAVSELCFGYTPTANTPSQSRSTLTTRIFLIGAFRRHGEVKRLMAVRAEETGLPMLTMPSEAAAGNEE